MVNALGFACGWKDGHSPGRPFHWGWFDAARCGIIRVGRLLLATSRGGIA